MVFRIFLILGFSFAFFAPLAVIMISLQKGLFSNVCPNLIDQVLCICLGIHPQDIVDIIH